MRPWHESFIAWNIFMQVCDPWLQTNTSVALIAIIHAMKLSCQVLICCKRHIKPFYFQSPKQSAKYNGRCRGETEPSFYHTSLFLLHWKIHFDWVMKTNIRWTATYIRDPGTNNSDLRTNISDPGTNNSHPRTNISDPGTNIWMRNALIFVHKLLVSDPPNISSQPPLKIQSYFICTLSWVCSWHHMLLEICLLCSI